MPELSEEVRYARALEALARDKRREAKKALKEMPLMPFDRDAFIVQYEEGQTEGKVICGHPRVGRGTCCQTGSKFRVADPSDQEVVAKAIHQAKMRHQRHLKEVHHREITNDFKLSFAWIDRFRGIPAGEYEQFSKYVFSDALRKDERAVSNEATVAYSQYSDEIDQYLAAQDEISFEIPPGDFRLPDDEVAVADWTRAEKGGTFLGALVGYFGTIVQALKVMEEGEERTVLEQWMKRKLAGLEAEYQTLDEGEDTPVAWRTRPRERLGEEAYARLSRFTEAMTITWTNKGPGLEKWRADVAAFRALMDVRAERMAAPHPPYDILNLVDENGPEITADFVRKVARAQFRATLAIKWGMMSFKEKEAWGMAGKRSKKKRKNDVKNPENGPAPKKMKKGSRS